MRAILTLLLLLACLPARAATDPTAGIPDPYRWLEDGKDPKVRAWAQAQDARARAYLDALPQRALIHERLMRMISATSPSFRTLQVAGGQMFATYVQPPKQQPMVAVLGLDADPAGRRVVIDPNAIDPSGATAIDWFVPSPDGKLVAVSLSRNGSEDGTLHLFDVASGRDTGLLIPRVQFPTAGGSVAWAPDGSGFWYTRYPGPDAPAERQHFYQQVFWHAMGTEPSADRYVLGRELPKVAEIRLVRPQGAPVAIAAVEDGDGGHYEHFLLAPGQLPVQATRFEDEVVAVAAGPDGALYLSSRKGAPRGRLLRTTVAHPDAAGAAVLLPEGEAALLPADEFGGEPIVVTPGAIYLREIEGGPSLVAVVTPQGKRLADLPLPHVAAVNEVVALPDRSVLYSVATYLRPPYFLRLDEATGKARETALAETSPISFADAEVQRIFATSKDGTKVPLTLVTRRGAVRDGRIPTLLYGYGGYGISEVPGFLGADVRLWLDAGGAYAVANLRGGGEYGADWHAQGALTHKQNVFDDFHAAAQALEAEHVTSPEHLAILGGSNGGLLMGAELTQHPEAFRVVVSLVGIYDMLRVELDPNGAFNTTEFGTVKDPAQFRALYAYSPYHHVVKGTPYPAVFMATGENDGRVNPMHSRKMMAALQAASSSGRPLLLSINDRAGHGIGSSLSIRVDQMSDWMAFLMDQLGMRLPAG